MFLSLKVLFFMYVYSSSSCSDDVLRTNRKKSASASQKGVFDDFHPPHCAYGRTRTTTTPMKANQKENKLTHVSVFIPANAWVMML